MRAVNFVFVMTALCGSAQAADSPLPDLTACVSEEYRPAKIDACAEVLSNAALPTDRRIIALYNHALGLISTMQVGLANNDLSLMTALDSKSEYAIKLQADIDDARKGAEGLLHCLPKALC